MKNRQHKKDHFLHPVSVENELTETVNMVTDELQSELNTLGKMASRFSPKPIKPVKIPERKPFVFSIAAPALAGSLVLMLIIFTYKVYAPSGANDAVKLEIVYHEIETDEIFMNEVASLVEDVAYSDFYPEAATDENRYDFSDEFIEVIVPI